jgi:tetratricopeptide (TPR) repeat protein
MLNIHELEKRWLQYKIKSYAPYVALFLSLILIASAINFFFFTNAQQKTKTSKHKVVLAKKQEQLQEQNITLPKQTSLQNEPIQQNKKVQKQEQTTLLAQPPYKMPERTLQPDMGFLEKFQHKNPQYHKEIKQAPPKKVIEKQKKRTTIAAVPVVEEEEMNLEPQKEKIKITIQRRESQNDIKEVIKRFQKNNNPALSLFVAKKYYELGDYKQAYNYALVTNKINNDIEDSWLIFAKSLVKLGKKGQAIKTLQKYITYSHSSNAQVLLDEIQRGKFQ